MVAAVVLAAGASSRFGTQKLIAPLAGRPLVRWTVERVLASRVGEVVVVVGRDADAVRETLAGLPVRCVINPRYASGQSTSLAAGVASLGGAVRAALVALGDQPSITPELVDALIDAYHASGRPIVAPIYQGTRGNPVLFDASLFAELGAVRGDQGAREVIARDPGRVARVELDAPMPPDVNDADDLEALERSLPWALPRVRP